MTKTRLDEAVEELMREMGHLPANVRDVLARYIPDTPAPTEETHDKLYVVGFHDPAFRDDPAVGVALDKTDARDFALEHLGSAAPVNEFRAAIWKRKLQQGAEDLGDVEVER